MRGNPIARLPRVFYFFLFFFSANRNLSLPGSFFNFLKSEKRGPRGGEFVPRKKSEKPKKSVERERKGPTASRKTVPSTELEGKGLFIGPGQRVFEGQV